MAVSGTISTTTFETRKVIDHALRRCRVPTQLITSEHLQIARDVLYLLMSEMVNRGIPLWCIEKILLPLYEGTTGVTCPLGTVDVLNLNIRKLQRLEGTASSTSGDADLAFDGDVETACTLLAAGGNITLEFDSETDVGNFGILPNATGTWNIAIQTSADGVTYTTVYADTELEVVAGEWIWIDVITPDTTDESVALSDVSFVRLLSTAPTVLDVSEFFIGNMPSEVPLARINRDDYMNLPDKQSTGRPNLYWLDLQRDQPVIRIWPAPQFQYTFYQLNMQRKRYLMDVGTLTETLDFPQRWFESVVAELAARLAYEIQEVDINLIPVLRGAADRATAMAWTGEGDNSPVYLRPNIRPYTV
jgi:hypothetical protein